MNIKLLFVIVLNIFGCLYTMGGEIKHIDFVDRMPKASDLKVGDITFVIPAVQFCLTDRYECQHNMRISHLDWDPQLYKYESRIPITCDSAIECKLKDIWKHPVSEHDHYSMLEFEPTDPFVRSLYPSIFMSTAHWDATVDFIINKLKQTKGYKEQVDDERKALQLKLDELQKRKSKLNNKIKEKEKELNEAFTAGDSQLYLRIKKEIKDLKDKVQWCKEDITSVNTKIEKLKG